MAGTGSLRKELDDLINEDQPQSLAMITAKIRDSVRVSAHRLITMSYG